MFEVISLKNLLNGSHEKTVTLTVFNIRHFYPGGISEDSWKGGGLCSSGGNLYFENLKIKYQIFRSPSSRHFLEYITAPAIHKVKK